MNERAYKGQAVPLSPSRESDEESLADSFASLRQARIGRIGAVRALWSARAKHVEEIAFEHFQEQNLDKIAELMDEKRKIEQRLTRLQQFLRTYEGSS